MQNNAPASAPVKTCRIVAPDSPDYIRQTNAIYPDLVATPGYQAQRRLSTRRISTDPHGNTVYEGVWVVIVERTCRDTVINLARRSGYEVQE